MLRLDNGPKLLVEHFVNWCQERNIEFLHIYILPGKPDRNAFIERFNRTYREEVLDTYLFETSDQVREVLEQWLQVYDEERFHEALAGMPPATFRIKSVIVMSSTFNLST